METCLNFRCITSLILESFFSKTVFLVIFRVIGLIGRLFLPVSSKSSSTKGWYFCDTLALPLPFLTEAFLSSFQIYYKISLNNTCIDSGIWTITSYLHSIFFRIRLRLLLVENRLNLFDVQQRSGSKSSFRMNFSVCL